MAGSSSVHLALSQTLTLPLSSPHQQMPSHPPPPHCLQFASVYVAYISYTKELVARIAFWEGACIELIGSLSKSLVVIH